ARRHQAVLACARPPSAAASHRRVRRGVDPVARVRGDGRGGRPRDALRDRYGARAAPAHALRGGGDDRATGPAAAPRGRAMKTLLPAPVLSMALFALW